MRMVMTYDRLSADELRGSSLADILISIESHFRLIDGNHTIYDEPNFPVVELARGLGQWVNQPEGNDFVFDSMSFEESGVLRVQDTPSGWVFGSVFTDIKSSPVTWAEVERCIQTFVSKVAEGLIDLGIDPSGVFPFLAGGGARDVQ